MSAGAEETVRQALLDELGRQAAISEGALTIEPGEERVVIKGPVDLDELVMVVMGSLAGGP
ncbi:hypothetical protein [Aureimonas ureilytica]|uniref:hypothetical protein n=1 Tax=Aureimonas ureilytica TaxID=401562 RepID=UPI00036DFED9|nr:hypothetical protein [Aureimonas ureilytica]